MRRPLPSLNALRAFEAASRHMSISLAADELCVTPAAISHQIRQLEDHFGLSLFERSGRGLMLTDAGQAGLKDLREGFERLCAAMDAVDQLGETGVLSISAAPSFALKWLLPRLDSFTRAHPAIDVRVVAAAELTDFTRDRVDMAIRFGAGHYPDLVSERLLDERLIVVCAPELQRRLLPFRRPEELARVTLLHDDGPETDRSCPDWERWLREAGIEDVDAARGPRFNQSSLVIEAAALGRGVALAKATLAEGELASGRLVPLFGYSQPLDFGYHVVATRAKMNLPKVAQFCTWLGAEAEIARKAGRGLGSEPPRRRVG